jgi:trk system potassium uptake protein TrkA
MSEKNRTFVVIGLGAFGGTVASELARFGNHVLGIDTRERLVAQYADTLSQAVIVDSTDEGALRELGIGQYDVALVAIGTDIEASILTTMNVRLLGVGSVWVKASTRTHHRILTKIGADRVIQPEHEMGQHIAQMLHNPAVRDYVSLGNGFHVVNIVVPEKLAGKALAEVKLAERFSLRPMGLMRGTEFFSCADEALTLELDDRLLVLGRRPDLRRFGDTL